MSGELVFVRATRQSVVAFACPDCGGRCCQRFLGLLNPMHSALLLLLLLLLGVALLHLCIKMEDAHKLFCASIVLLLGGGKGGWCVRGVQERRRTVYTCTCRSSLHNDCMETQMRTTNHRTFCVPSPSHKCTCNCWKLIDLLWGWQEPLAHTWYCWQKEALKCTVVSGARI